MHGRVIGTVSIALTMAGMAMVAGPPQKAAASTSTPHYYVSLGDSLAQGVQPDSAGVNQITNNGYADQLFATVQSRFKHPLLLEKLGCPGENTTSMINGAVQPSGDTLPPSPCTYPQGSQLAAAEAFISTHPVAFVTIDIGANNVDGCIIGGVINQACLVAGITAAVTDLPVILAGLQAADPGVEIRGMNYYDPFLAAWLTGPAGQTLAQQSAVLASVFNSDLSAIFHAFHVKVVDVAGAFQTPNFTIDPKVGIPINVELICAWTYMCAPSPVGPNIHATTPGYAVIAGAFAATIRSNAV